MLFNRKIPDEEIIEGLKKEAIEAQLYENTLFDRFTNLKSRGKKVHYLTPDESLEAYCDAILDFVVFVRQGKYENDLPIAAILPVIFNRRCKDLKRKKTAKKRKINQGQVDLTLVAETPNGDPSALDLLISSDLFERILPAFRGLSEKCQKIIKLWSEGYPHAEIAVQVEMKNAASAKTGYQKCMRKLRSLLGLSK